MTEAVQAERDGAGRPVIIAKGFFPIPLPTIHIEAAYNSRGFRARMVPHRLRNKLDVRTYAASIAYEIREAAKEYDGKVDAVGTSMGGVALYYALMFMDVAPLVRTAVAAGAPFHGSPATLPGRPVPVLGRSARQLTPGSRLLALMRRTELPPGPKYVSLCGTKDLIARWPTTFIEGALNPHWKFDHLDLMFTGRVHHRIAEEILLDR